MQIVPQYTNSLHSGGATPCVMVQHAAMLIEAGVCNTVLIAFGDNRLTGMTRDKAIAALSELGNAQFEVPYGPLMPTLLAFQAQRHMALYGTTPEQFAWISVTQRKHAKLYPGAQFKEEITVEDVLNSKPISSPLNLLNITPIFDGAGALVVTSAERAARMNRPVYVMGFGQQDLPDFFTKQEVSVTAAHQSGKKAYAMAGIGPKDVDVAMLYDCCTNVVLTQLEDLGFCPKGEGGPFVEGGTRIGLTGEIPVNTNGGELNIGIAGIFHITEACRQLRGEAGERQVKDAKIAIVQGLGGNHLSAGATLILANDKY